MGLLIFQVDAFTSNPFGGNPACVCLLPDSGREATPAWMQRVAAEMNVAETAFLAPREDGYGLRWFSPTVEVDLCGHATLASAHVLWETGRLTRETQARFHTASGLLTCDMRGDLIQMDFPATPAEPVDPPPGLIEALGVTPVFVGRSRFDYLVVIDSAKELRSLKPDIPALGRLATRGVIVTSPSDVPYFQFVSRFFAPATGIDEDPATGSSHCCLGPYWAERFGRTELSAFQASPRKGAMRVEVRGDRVLLGGHAVTVLRGELSDSASEFDSSEAAA